MYLYHISFFRLHVIRSSLVQLFRQSTVICRKSVQVLGLRQRLEAAAGRGDMRKIVDDLNRAYDRGRLGADQAVLMNFIRDLARNMNAAGASGNRQDVATRSRTSSSTLNMQV
jgi:hypothetical protein